MYVWLLVVTSLGRIQLRRVNSISPYRGKHYVRLATVRYITRWDTSRQLRRVNNVSPYRGGHYVRLAILFVTSLGGILPSNSDE
jgi:hypothetical protein